MSLIDDEVNLWMHHMDYKEKVREAWRTFYEDATAELGPEPPVDAPPTCAEVVESQGEELARAALAQWRETQSRTACSHES